MVWWLWAGGGLYQVIKQLWSAWHLGSLPLWSFLSLYVFTHWSVSFTQWPQQARCTAFIREKPCGLYVVSAKCMSVTGHGQCGECHTLASGPRTSSRKSTTPGTAEEWWAKMIFRKLHVQNTCSKPTAPPRRDVSRYKQKVSRWRGTKLHGQIWTTNAEQSTRKEAKGKRNTSQSLGGRKAPATPHNPMLGLLWNLQ